jgi:hypothetical protein
MTTKTPNIELTEVGQAESQAYESLNSSFWALDAIVQLACESRTITDPPADPVQGDRYIIPEGSPTATGAWAGWERAVAYWSPDGWNFYLPRVGWRAYVKDEGAWLTYNGTSWIGTEVILTTKGDLLTYGSEAARLAVGSNKQVLQADSAEALGVKWANLLSTKGDLLAYSTALTTLGLGSNDQVLTADSTQSTGLKWATPSGGTGGSGLDPANRWDFYDDLVGNINSRGWAIGGTGGIDYTLGTAGHPGVVEVDTQTGTTGQYSLLYANTYNSTIARYIQPGGGTLCFRALINLPALMNGTTDTGQVRLGFANELSGAPTHGLHAQFDAGFAYWRLYSRGGAAGTVNDSSGNVTVATGWTLIEIYIYDSAAGSPNNAALYVDGVLAAELSTAMTTNGLAFGFQCAKASGTTPQRMEIDFIHVWQEFATARY